MFHDMFVCCLFPTELVPLQHDGRGGGVLEVGGAVRPLQVGAHPGEGEVEGEVRVGEVREQRGGVGGAQEAGGVPAQEGLHLLYLDRQEFLTEIRLFCFSSFSFNIGSYISLV